jgi:hypothetical protein
MHLKNLPRKKANTTYTKPQEISEALTAFSHINKAYRGNNMGKSSHLKNLPTLFHPVRIYAPSQNAVFCLKKPSLQ